MSQKLMLLLIILANIANCERTCKRVYAPVCGRNNKTYHNECSAKNKNVDIECQVTSIKNLCIKVNPISEGTFFPMVIFFI